MKIKLLYLIIPLSIHLQGLKAQCWNIIKTASTDPADNSVYSFNPLAPNTPRNPNSSSSPAHWDWVNATTISFYSLAGTTPDQMIKSPFYCLGSVANNGGCSDPNILTYNNISISGAYSADLHAKHKALDILPEDGWELLKYDFGQPTAPTNLAGTQVSRPYFCIYNRYTGKIKFFIALTGISGSLQANKATVKVYLGGKESAILSYAEPISQVMESYTHNLKFVQPNDIVTLSQSGLYLEYYWLSAEVPIAYDPCVCNNPNTTSSLSRIWFEVETTNSSSVNWTVTGELNPQTSPLYGPVYGSSSNYNADGKSSKGFIETATGAAKSAMQGYQNWNEYASKIKGYLQSLNGNSTTAPNNPYVTQVATTWYNETYPGQVATPTQMVTTFFSFANSQPTQATSELTGLNDNTKLISFVKNAASVLPYVGAAIGLFDYFTGGGNDKTTTQNANITSVPSPPTTYDVKLKVEGQIVTAPLSQAKMSFLTPGTYDNADFTQVNNVLYPNSSVAPMYNNPLGVFNVLIKPEFEYKKITSATSSGWYTANPPNNPPTTYCDWNDNTLQYWQGSGVLKNYRVKTNVKYTFNPAARLDIESIDAAIVFEYKNNRNLFWKDIHNYDFPNLITIPYYSGFNLDNGGITLQQRIDNMKSAGFELEFMDKDYPASTTSVIRIRTKYVPLECLESLNWFMFGSGMPDRVMLKLYAKFSRNNNSSAEPVTSIYTYDITDKFTAAINAGNGGSAYATVSATSSYNNISQGNCTIRHEYTDFVLKNLSVSTPAYANALVSAQNINYTQVMNSVTAANNVTIPSGAIINNNVKIAALNKIIVGTNVTFGTNVELVAGKEIEVATPNVINPTNVTLRVQHSVASLAYGCNPQSTNISNFQANQAEILSVCNSLSYDNILARTRNPNDSLDPPTEPQVELIAEELEYTADHEAEETSSKNNLPLNKKNKIEIYPNPTIGDLNISVLVSSDQDLLLYLEDISGKRLLEKPIHVIRGDNMDKVSLDMLTNGIYFVKIINTKGALVKAEKIIVNK